MKKFYLALIGLFCVYQAHSQITVVNAIVPQYIQGTAPTNNNRTPFFFWVELTGMTPGATYRFYTQMDSLGAAPTSNGAGVVYMINMPNQTFRRTATGSLNNPASHDSMVASGTGTWSGWMGVEPSGNGRFTPGNTLYPKIIFNNGAGGTAVAQRLTLTGYPVSVINYGTSSGNPQQGSFVYDSTTVAPKSFVGLYDNVSGTGRPVSFAVIESDGMALIPAMSVVAAYRNLVDSMQQRWGTIIPNNLANGVRLLQYRNFSDATVLTSLTDADGNWCWANTVNPSNSTTAVYIRSLESIPNPQIQNLSTTYCTNDSITLLATGTGTITWYTTGTGGPVIATGSSVTVLADTVFYAQSDTNGCTSGRDSVFFTLQTPSVYYADTDFDAYGDPDDSLVTCNFVIGWVGNNLDCDDSDFNVNPDATELCNGYDDNCDNQVDEGCLFIPEFSFSYPNYIGPPPTGGNVVVDTVAHTITLPMFNCYVKDTLDFYIHNSGNDTLTIVTPVTISSQSSVAIGFSIIQQPQSMILPGDSSSLKIELETIIPWGTDSAVVSIGNNDFDENPYVFTIYSSSTCGGVNNEGGINNVRMYPVPATNVCYLDMNVTTATDVHIVISDLSGKQVYQVMQSCLPGMNKITLPVQNLSQGIYLVEINDGNTSTTKKLIRK